jgi:hypothetical protein
MDIVDAEGCRRVMRVFSDAQLILSHLKRHSGTWKTRSIQWTFRSLEEVEGITGSRLPVEFCHPYRILGYERVSERPMVLRFWRNHRSLPDSSDSSAGTWGHVYQPRTWFLASHNGVFGCRRESLKPYGIKGCLRNFVTPILSSDGGG